MATDTDAYALLDALFANAPVGLAFWDAELRYRRVNAALAEINGIAPADHLGRTPGELLGDLGRAAEAVITGVLRDGTPRVEIPFEGQTPALPGERRHWAGTFYPVTSAGEAVLGVAAVIVEVTGEREARREHQAASALLDAVFDAAPVGIGFWDLDLRFRRVNGALAELHGVPPEEHLGRRPEEVLGEGGLPLSEVVAEVARSGEALERELEVPGEDGRGFREAIVYPVVDARGDVVGMAGVLRDVTEQHEVEAERSRLLREAFTARAAAEAAKVRAENARADAEDARRRTEFLARAGERLAVVTRDYEQTLREVARVAVPDMADGCVVTLLDPRGQPRTASVAAIRPELEAVERELGRRYPVSLADPGGIAAALRSGEPELLAVVDDEKLRQLARDEEHLRLLRELGVRSLITAPLRVRGRTVGVLSLATTDPERAPFGPDDVRIARSLAVRAALAVENARLYTERSHIAQTLQRSLLPPALPNVPGLELAARYRAAGEENEVGGDFYDAFRSADGVWTVVIGDVSGKGAEAAALTSLTRHTLRAASLRTQDPIESLGVLNDALWSQNDPAGRFCTVLLAQVRPDAHGAEVTLATGGHLPPLILRAGGRVERAQVRGAIAGGLREATFGDRRLRLDHDDVLVFFTDGLTELRVPGRRGIVSGEADLERLLGELRGAAADELVRALERQAVDLQGGEPRDDIAIVAVRPCAPGSASA